MASYLFVDIESTALGDNAGVIEIAAIPVIDGIEHPHFHSMIRPHDGCTLDPKAFEVTGIDIKEIWSYPDAKEVINEFVTWIDSHESVFSIAGHNVTFDRNKLFRLFCRNGAYGDFITRFNNRDYCTLRKSREIFKGKRNKPDNFKLETLCQFFDIQVTNSHRALVDIQNTIKVYFELEKIKQSEEAKQEEAPYKEKARKYLDIKYIQMNPEGDIFITTEATKDPIAMRFLLNHMWNMYG